jgi:hypothetical protein
MNGYIVCLNRIIYNSDPAKHTVQYDKYARQASRNGESDWKSWEGTVQAAFSPSYPEAVNMIAKSVKDYLEKGWWQLDAKDFEFEVIYSEVKDGRFYLISNISQSGKMKVYSN